MGWIGCVLCEKFWHDFVTQTFALIAPVQYILQQVSCSYEMIPKHPNTMKRTETLVLGPMGWIRSVRCEKTRRDFVARTFALIAPVHPVLHRVSWSYEMIPNAHKHYETHQNMRLGSNGVDQVRSLQKITLWLHSTNFCIYCTSSIYFATSFMQLRYDPRCTQILRNGLKH